MTGISYDIDAWDFGAATAAVRRSSLALNAVYISLTNIEKTSLSLPGYSQSRSIPSKLYLVTKSNAL